MHKFAWKMDDIRLQALSDVQNGFSGEMNTFPENPISFSIFWKSKITLIVYANSNEID